MAPERKGTCMDYYEPEQEATRLKVIGIGGAGLNAVNAMIAAGLTGVEFLAVSTSTPRLRRSNAGIKIKIGLDTRGFGTGGNPEVGRRAIQESSQEITEQLTGADLVFLTAGLGGGTGTGALPVIATLARKQGSLVAGIVTKPFSREGKHRQAQAEQGIRELLPLVDCLIVIPNDRLIGMSTKGASLLEAFKPADDLLRQAVQGIVEIICEHGHINVDFSDVRTVLGAKGMAMMGIGSASGENRAIEAANRAIQNPLLEDLDLQEAKGVLLNISGSSEMTLDEYDQVCRTVTGQLADDATVIVGMVVNDALGDQMKVTVIATGLKPPPGCEVVEKKGLERRFRLVDATAGELDTPTFMRNRSQPPYPKDR